MSQVLHQAELQPPALRPDAAHELDRPTVVTGAANGFVAHAAKRFLDVVIAIGALIVTGPLILIGAVAIKLGSRGPAFYRAKRAGLGGQPFFMLKLRTMRVGADSPDRKITAQEDDRVTGAGRLLRRFRIDEFPQFWHVLRGDMAIVGPRPEDWDIVQQHYTDHYMIQMVPVCMHYIIVFEQHSYLHIIVDYLF